MWVTLLNVGVAALLLVVVAVVIRDARSLRAREIGPDLAREESQHLLLALLIALLLVTALWVAGEYRSLILLSAYLFFWTYLPIKLLQRRRLGRVLIVLPWSRRNTMQVVLAGSLLLMGVAIWLRTPVSKIDAISHLLVIGLVFVGGITRLEIRELGIASFPGIRPWPTILAHAREQDLTNPVLRLELRSRIPGFRFRRWPIPVACKGAVAEVLARHVPPAGAVGAA